MMPEKGSRLITVGDAVYRWRVRRKPGRRQGDGWTPLRFTVERAEEPGSVLVVTLPCARPDNWRGNVQSPSVRSSSAGASGGPSSEDGGRDAQARRSSSTSPRTNWPGSSVSRPDTWSLSSGA
ncbi:hypothetical protein ACFSTC_49575 [Nonomuraea ferruginea]